MNHPRHRPNVVYFIEILVLVHIPELDGHAVEHEPLAG